MDPNAKEFIPNAMMSQTKFLAETCQLHHQIPYVGTYSLRRASLRETCEADVLPSAPMTPSRTNDPAGGPLVEHCIDATVASAKEQKHDASNYGEGAMLRKRFTEDEIEAMLLKAMEKGAALFKAQLQKEREQHRAEYGDLKLEYEKLKATISTLDIPRMRKNEETSLVEERKSEDIAAHQSTIDDKSSAEAEFACVMCGEDNPDDLLTCANCNNRWHGYCTGLDPLPKKLRRGATWRCTQCEPAESGWQALHNGAGGWICKPTHSAAAGKKLHSG